MKKHLLLLVLFLLPSVGNSQVLISLLLGDKLNTGKIEFGLEGGVNWSKISGMESGSYYRALNLGFYFDIRVKQPWYIYTGVLVRARQGTANLSEADLEFLNAETYDVPGEYSQVTSTFIVPIMLKYRFESNVFVYGGPQFGLMYNAWVDFESNADNKEAEIKEFNEDLINRIDAGVTFGIGYKLHRKDDHGMSFALRYYYGFVDVYKNKSGTENRVIFLTMTVPIGVGSD